MALQGKHRYKPGCGSEYPISISNSQMDKNANRMAAAANAIMFDEQDATAYIAGAPHLKHLSLRALYEDLTMRVFMSARINSATPTILDLGAGEGSATIRFLELGARVTAVDISESQLRDLRRRCGRYGDRLEVHCEEIEATMLRETDVYDVVVMNSFIHHIPDYLAAIGNLLPLLKPRGQFFSFQDPLRYDTLERRSFVFSQLAYFSWRMCQGNLWRGLKTRLRRVRGVYIAGSPEDDAEYHVTRNGVDHAAIVQLLESERFNATVVRYFSTQSGFLQRVGAFLALENTFSITAQRRPD
jgi:2-polyprenyl-6-hydroxyphenyl methylase / 3-demethylubiquinone-9 3-methyltransferase